MTGPEAAGLPADARLDVLTRTLRIWQREGGHKATSDDLLLAAWAGQRRPEARRCLDLGTGKGTVAMLLTALLPEARVLGLEAYPESHALALHNIAENGLADRFDARLGDLRDPAALTGERPFDLVTGAPPFMPVGSGVLPRDPQRAAGRFELRGGVEAYAAAAAAHLAPGGACVLLMDGAGGARAARALEGVGLIVFATLEVRPRPGSAPTYRLLAAGVEPETAREHEVLHMRDAEGDTWSAAYAAIRRQLDLPGA